MRFHFMPPRLRQASSILVALLLWEGFSPCLLSQEASIGQIKIIIMEGDGAINNIRQRTTREPIVQVEDENHKPVAGALVVFTLPDSGAGGTFANGAKSTMVYSDKNGQAKARGYNPGQVAGAFQIKVAASFKGLTAAGVINQSNAAATAAAAGGISAKVIAIIAVAGAAAAAGAVIATHQKQQPTTVSIGTPTVGRP
jgi:hypothetical protein